MPRYRYDAEGEDGKRQSGQIDADGPDDAFVQLEAEGVHPVVLEEVYSPRPPWERGLTAKEVSEFTRQLAGLTQTGLPLPGALMALGKELPGGNLRRVLLDMARKVEAGATLEEAIELQEKRFPSHVRSLVLAGTRSGRLGEVLGQFVELDQAGAELRRRLWVTLAYPIFLMTCASVLFLAIAHFVVLDFDRIFKDFGIDLPSATKALVKVSRGVARAGWWVFFGPLLAFFGIWLVERFAMSPAERRRIACEMPLFGPLWRWSALAEFSHLLAALIQHEVPLPAALPLAGDGVKDAELADACHNMVPLIESGEPLSAAVARHPQFPFGYAQILEWAENHQSLPDALRMAGEMYEARARTQATFVGTVCSVAIVLAVLSGIVYTYGALFLPLIQLISKLSG